MYWLGVCILLVNLDGYVMPQYGLIVKIFVIMLLGADNQDHIHNLGVMHVRVDPSLDWGEMEYTYIHTYIHTYIIKTLNNLNISVAESYSLLNIETIDVV